MRFELLVALACLVSGALGCGAAPAPAPAPERVVAVALDDFNLPPDKMCALDHCDTKLTVSPASIQETGDGVMLDFAAHTSPAAARHVVFHCRVLGAGDDNPQHAGVACPVDLGAVKIDVSEGPAGTSFMLHIGDTNTSAATRQWYEDHFR